MCTCGQGYLSNKTAIVNMSMALYSPQKALTALKFLKSNKPLYALVEMNEQWYDQALANDE